MATSLTKQWWLKPLLLLLLLWVCLELIGLGLYRDKIESRLENDVMTKLDDVLPGHGAQVQFSGRDGVITLYAEHDSSALAGTVKAVAHDVEGVRVIRVDVLSPARNSGAEDGSAPTSTPADTPKSAPQADTVVMVADNDINNDINFVAELPSEPSVSRPIPSSEAVSPAPDYKAPETEDSQTVIVATAPQTPPQRPSSALSTTTSDEQNAPQTVATAPEQPSPAPTTPTLFSTTASPDKTNSESGSTGFIAGSALAFVAPNDRFSLRREGFSVLAEGPLSAEQRQTLSAYAKQNWSSFRFKDQTSDGADIPDDNTLDALVKVFTVHAQVSDTAEAAWQENGLVLRGDVPDAQTEMRILAAADSLPAGQTLNSRLRRVAPNAEGLYVSERSHPIEQWPSAELRFAVGSFVLDSQSKDKLASLVPLIAQYAGRVEIAGHTDNTGDPDANQRLSLARAAGVRDELIRHGIAPAQLRIAGYAARRPIASQDNAEDRAKNRRIEFTVLGDR